MDQYRSRPKLSENLEGHWSIPFPGEIRMDQSLVHTLSWGNSYGPMVLKVLQEFPPTLVLVHGWLFPAGKGVMMFRNSLARVGRDPDIVNFGSAAGAEYRHNPQGFFHPYALVLRRPEAFLPTYHIINTQEDNNTVSKLLECPCTPQRKIDPKNGTIDGKKPYPPFDCSSDFAATGNRACNLSTYVGGWRCCEHHMFVIDTDKECRDPQCADKPKDRVFMKFRFEYEDETPATRNIEPAACCDTTSSKQGMGNIEHDVPACENKGKDDDCTYVTESVQPVGYYDDKPPSEEKGSDLVDLVYAAPHLHWSGISTELIDAVTNKTLCKVERTKDNSCGMIYGTGDEPGNERDYLVGLFPCQWTPETAPRFRRDHPLRSRSVYSATEYHMGVMSLWLMSVSAVPKNLSAMAAKNGFVV